MEPNPDTYKALKALVDSRMNNTYGTSIEPNLDAYKALKDFVDSRMNNNTY